MNSIKSTVVSVDIAGQRLRPVEATDPNTISKIDITVRWRILLRSLLRGKLNVQIELTPVTIEQVD